MADYAEILRQVRAEFDRAPLTSNDHLRAEMRRLRAEWLAKQRIAEPAPYAIAPACHTPLADDYCINCDAYACGCNWRTRPTKPVQCVPDAIQPTYEQRREEIARRRAVEAVVDAVVARQNPEPMKIKMPPADPRAEGIARAAARLNGNHDPRCGCKQWEP